MQFMTALFGGPNSTYLNAAFALGIVLVLIVMGVWVLKVFTKASGDMVRGSSKRRLTIVDQVVVDNKRRLLIVRRDNVEHVILTGGPQDLLVESGIAVAEQQPQPANVRRNVRPTPRPEMPADIETPIETPHTVSRDTVDRLRDLARPAPLRSDPPLRRTGLLRPVAAERSTVIPIAPPVFDDNPDEPVIDSAKTGSIGGTGETRLGAARNRFFRSTMGSD
ncbi:MAG: hypothetical protein ABL879_09025 [Devosia sp.]